MSTGCHKVWTLIIHNNGADGSSVRSWHMTVNGRSGASRVQSNRRLLQMERLTVTMKSDEELRFHVCFKSSAGLFILLHGWVVVSVCRNVKHASTHGADGITAHTMSMKSTGMLDAFTQQVIKFFFFFKSVICALLCGSRALSRMCTPHLHWCKQAQWGAACSQCTTTLIYFLIMHLYYICSLCFMWQECKKITLCFKSRGNHEPFVSSCSQQHRLFPS